MLIASANATFHDDLRRCFGKEDGERKMGSDRPSAAITSVFDARQLLLSVHVGRPEILLLDVELANAMHKPMLPTLLALRPEIRILLFYETLTFEQVLRALVDGAKGCILKTAAPAEWCKAIQVLEGDELWLDRKLFAQALACLRSQTWDGLQHAPLKEEVHPDRPHLTRRESEIARWASGSMTNKEIARHLKISEATVKTHLQNIFVKLQITRRMQLGHADEGSKR